MRVLLIADTHLGFDLPLRPRIDRPRRGEDFFANFARALGPARRREVDLVVHAGDLFFRSRVRASVIERAIRELLAVAEAGVPIVLVPGNHERSSLPGALLAAHPRFLWFDRPRTFGFRRGADGGLERVAEGRPCELAVGGFPCERGDVRSRFAALLAAARGGGGEAGLRLLALHQAVEGARVGPHGFTFRDRPDTIRGRDLPAGFAAITAGHIHRHQVLRCDLRGQPLPAPVLYPGSTERTSFAERRESKGYLTLDLLPGADGGRLLGWRFHPLPSRPMVDLELAVDGSTSALVDGLRRRLRELPDDAMIRMRLRGRPAPEAARLLTSSHLRRLALPTQIVAWHPGSWRDSGRPGPLRID